MNALANAARNAIALAKPKKSERLLVVTDEPSMEVGLAIYRAASKKCEAALMMIAPTGQHGREPPKAVARALLDYNIVYAPTAYSLTHTNAIRAARNKGGRIATLPGITKQVFIRGMGADYNQIHSFGAKLKKKYEAAEWIHVTAKGTDAWFKIGNREILNDDGQLHQKKYICNLPAGEVGLAPKGAWGAVTVYKSPFVKKGTKFTFEKDNVIGCTDPKFKKMIWAKKTRRNIAEFSIGTNPKAKLSGNVLEDEKVKGTFHFAVGDSKSMQGTVTSDIHIDFIIEKPTIYFDDKEIMREGAFI